MGGSASGQARSRPKKGLNGKPLDACRSEGVFRSGLGLWLTRGSHLSVNGRFLGEKDDLWIYFSNVWV
ncbi:hypothetical protein EYF80_018806 [Liparis tanakae]|uniref:Uncharacterized protein n=1 Tax=Liparis tanakae TaxID=230148 RepID=A0A4Z2HZL7_9TELE|nr:hypothetical protein EYF80_018806 [Liparis tanakae]